MSPRALVLVDGEHYPPVTEQAISSLNHEVVAAVFLGGGEKLSGELKLGALPIVRGTGPVDAVRRALATYDVDLVLDISDAPVVDPALRTTIACLVLAHGATYQGADFTFTSSARARISRVPTISVIGTGKRTGKTAISAALARHALARGRAPVIVAMGRGGPAEPRVVDGRRERPDARALLALADAGEHAASDSYEDAVVAGVPTVGARRAGAGFAGATMFDTVPRAVAVAEQQGADLLILEGSGTAIPPARADATLLVAGGSTPLDAWLPYRLLISDLVVVTMAEEPVLSTETISALTSQLLEFAADVPVVKTVFRPHPVGAVAGRKIFFATTAPSLIGPVLVEHLAQTYGAVVAGTTHALANRAQLAADLERAEGTYDVLLTELKAAAIDVAARAALRAGADVVFADNLPVDVDGDLHARFDDLIARAEERAR